MFYVRIVWTLAILWDTPNVVCWSSDQQVQLPNTFHKHHIPIRGENSKSVSKNAIFCSFLKVFTHFKFLVVI